MGAVRGCRRGPAVRTLELTASLAPQHASGASPHPANMASPHRSTHASPERHGVKRVRASARNTSPPSRCRRSDIQKFVAVVVEKPHHLIESLTRNVDHPHPLRPPPARLPGSRDRQETWTERRKPPTRTDHPICSCPRMSLAGSMATELQRAPSRGVHEADSGRSAADRHTSGWECLRSTLRRWFVRCWPVGPDEEVRCRRSL
jgi:hypothetical protein